MKLIQRSVTLIYRTEAKITEAIEVHEDAIAAHSKLDYYNNVCKAPKSKSEYFIRPITLFLKEGEKE